MEKRAIDLDLPSSTLPADLQPKTSPSHSPLPSPPLSPFNGANSRLPAARDEVRVLVTGASGLLGRALMKAFSEYNTLGVALTRAEKTLLPDGTLSSDASGTLKRSPSPPNYSSCQPYANPEATKPPRTRGDGAIVRCDLTNDAQVRELVLSFQPHIIIHAAAQRRPEVCEVEREKTERLNVRSTAILGELAASLKDCWLLLISTDYVFDGTSPPYKTNAPTNPLNYYGRSKRDAELAVWDSKHNGGVLRIPLLYGSEEHIKESGIVALVLDVERAANGTTPVRFDHNAIRSPTLVDDVALVCLKLAQRRLRHCGLTGTWHFSGAEKMTKYQLALEIAKQLQLPTDNIIADRHPLPQAVARPRDSTLDTTALYLMGMDKKTTFEVGLAQVLANIARKRSSGVAGF